jgi:hypothetical protein
MIDAHELAVKWHFAQDGEGYIYYSGPHSRGIRVTAAEREVFIHGTSDEWLDVIDDREPTEPPRPFWPALLGRLRDLPFEMAILPLGTGLLCIKKAYDTYVDLPFADERAPLVLAAWALGAMLLVPWGVFSLWNLRQRHEGDVR